MFLKGTSDVLRINSASAADIEVTIHWGDSTDGSPPVLASFGRSVIASITGTGNTTLLTGVSAHTLKVKSITVHNNHATVSSVVYCDLTDGTSTNKIAGSQCTLAAGEALELTEGGPWIHYDVNGGIYPAFGVAATQAEMEAASATDRFVSPAGVKWSPAAAKFWVKTKPGNVNSASYNVSGVDDTTAGITTVTFATAFSSVEWSCQCSVESASDTMTVTSLKLARIGLADQAAGTVKIECHDVTAITAVIEDPTAWHVCGFGDL